MHGLTEKWIHEDFLVTDSKTMLPPHEHVNKACQNRSSLLISLLLMPYQLFETAPENIEYAHIIFLAIKAFDTYINKY